jgi:hypothetical protein
MKLIKASMAPHLFPLPFCVDKKNRNKKRETERESERKGEREKEKGLP